LAFGKRLGLRYLFGAVMSIELPARPQKGAKIPHDYFQRMWDHQKSLELHGDLKTTTVKRDRSGTTVHAHTRGGSTTNRTSAIIAQIDTDNNDGTYDATEQKNAAGTFSDRSASTGLVFDSGTNGNLYELNGLQGVPVGTYVVVHRVENTSGGPIWYFDGGASTYGVDGSGAWVKITANTSSPYSWAQLDADGTTLTTPSVTGSSNLHEVNGYDGYLKDKIVWARFDGTAYRFEYRHRAFLAKITSGTSTYAWTEMQDNGTTATTRTGTGAVEVNGRTGIPANTIVTMLQDAGSSTFRFVYSDGRIFPVTVTQTGGSAGNATTQCSFTYTVTSLDAATLLTAAAPIWNRPQYGKLVAGTHGTAYYNTAGVCKLYQVDEVPDVTVCT
jgi:hypothetical protein